MVLKFLQMVVGGRGEASPKEAVAFKVIPLEEKSLWQLGFDLWRAGHDWSEPSNYIMSDKGKIDGILLELSRRDRDWLEFMEWQKDKELWRRIKRERFEKASNK